jgi:hypothetical protein
MANISGNSYLRKVKKLRRVAMLKIRRLMSDHRHVDFRDDPNYREMSRKLLNVIKNHKRY